MIPHFHHSTSSFKRVKEKDSVKVTHNIRIKKASNFAFRSFVLHFSAHFLVLLTDANERAANQKLLYTVPLLAVG